MHIHRILAALFVLTCLTPMHAADYYLRGVNFGNWQPLEQYKFAPDADGTWRLHVDRLDGQFKIADAEWTYDTDFGAPAVHKFNLLTSASFTPQHRGGNITAYDLRDVDIILDPVTPRLQILAAGRPVSHPGTSGTLPVMFIDVYTDETHSEYEDEVTDYNLAHKDYFTEATYRIGDSDPLPLQIKARGNWTRKGFSKKPFKIKLDKKAALLGLSSSKHFALLAHADDSWGWLRNFTGFALGKRIGLPWTPSQTPVELVLNGDPRGVYFLTESIRVDKNRVAIEELDDLCEDPALASGGYIVELDNYDEDNQLRLTEKTAVNGHRTDALRVTFDTPEELSPLQLRFITDQFNAINDAVGAASPDVWKYLDLDDAVRYYIVTEVLSHTEAYHGSTYLFRNRGEGQKWHFSPLWDLGNAFAGPTDGYFYDHDPYGNTWIPSLSTDVRFRECLTKTWMWFVQSVLPGLDDEMTEYASSLQAAAQADYLRWKNEAVPAGGQPVADNRDMGGRLDAALKHLQAKTAWLKQQWGTPSPSVPYPEPTADNTPAAPLPEYLSGIQDIVPDEAPEHGHKLYYNILGQPLTSPAPGQWYLTPRR